VSDHRFFSTDNRHNERQIRILSVGSLVSKPPTKEKRISIKVRMPLSGGETGVGTMGAPEWLDAGYIFVSKHHDTVTPEIEFKGYSIELSVENLFGDDIKSPDCIMRGFEITECGNEETPDVVLSFTIRMPFSSKKWNYLGQYVGEDVWAKFIPGEAGTAFVETEDGTLLDDGENEETEEESVAKSQGAVDGFFETKESAKEEWYTPVPDDPEEEPEAVSGKSGPAELKAFHEAELEKEAKRKPGRPKKVTEEF
jgi:hypothetical protein